MTYKKGKGKRELIFFLLFLFYFRSKMTLHVTEETWSSRDIQVIGYTSRYVVLSCPKIPNTVCYLFLSDANLHVSTAFDNTETLADVLLARNFEVRFHQMFRGRTILRATSEQGSFYMLFC